MSENKEKNDDIIEYGQTDLDKNKEHKKIHLLNIIGEIEGHDCLSSNTKTTKYEHVIPTIAEVEDNDEYCWWRCGVWTCNSRDDCKYE